MHHLRNIQYYRKCCGRRRHPGVRWLSFVIIAAWLLAILVPMGAPAQPQPSLQQQYVDLRKGTYEETDVLDQIPRALPGFVAGASVVLLLAGLFGLYEMSALTTFALVAVIGTIFYRFYWHPITWHP